MPNSPAIPGFQVADHLGFGVAVVDASGRQTYVNGAFAAMVGWSAEELVGAVPPFVYWPEEEMAKISEALERTMRGAAPPEGFELRFRRREGEIFDALVSATELPRAAGGSAWVASVTDITRQKRAQEEAREQERRLGLALEAGRLGTWEWDMVTNRVTWSPLLERIHGLEEGSFPGTLEAYQSDIHPEDRDTSLGAVARAAAAGGVHHVQHRIVLPNGEVRWVESWGQFALNDEGRPVRLVGVSSDVTDRVTSDQRLRDAMETAERARRAAEEANEAKSTFLATMSHELRTPLNAMIGYAELLQMGVPDPIPEGAQVQVERIGRAARHLLSLIDEILTFSRIEAGRETVEPAPVDVRELVDEVSAVVEPLAAAKGLAFRAARPSDPTLVVTDPRKLRQILINLLGNAVKFTDEGSVALEIERGGGVLVLRVRDTGVGIAPEFQEQIFEPFRQVDRARTRQVEGSGLGLAVSRRLARLMGGDVTVRSEPGRGSTFTATIPLGR